MADKPYIWHCELPGAPTVNGTPGSLINVLEKVLVTGWEIGTIVDINVQDGVAKCIFNSSYETNFKDKLAHVKISETGDDALNGEHEIIAFTANSVSWKTTAGEGIRNNGGKISIPAAGWSKPFSGENKAAFRSNNPSSSGYYFYFDDTTAQYASIQGCRVMNDIDDREETFPSGEILAGVGKSVAADTNGKLWMIIGDDRGFYYFFNTHGKPEHPLRSIYSSPLFSIYIGDYVSLDGDENNNAIVNARIATDKSSYYSDYRYLDTNSLGDFRYKEIYHILNKDLNYNIPGRLAKDSTGSISDKAYFVDYPVIKINTPKEGGDAFSGAQGYRFPSVNVNRLTLTKGIICDSDKPRGVFPGFLFINNALSKNFVVNNFVDSRLTIDNHKCFSVYVYNADSGYYNHNQNNKGNFFLIDFTQWRNPV